MRSKSLRNNKKYSKAMPKQSLNSNLGCLILRSIWRCSKSHVKRWPRSTPSKDQMKASGICTVQCPTGHSTNLQHRMPLYEPSRTSLKHSHESNQCDLAPSVSPLFFRMIMMKKSEISNIRAIDTVKIKQLITTMISKMQLQTLLITEISSDKGSIDRM